VVELDDTDRVSAARERSAETHLNIVGGPKPAPDLKTTLRRARIENAERSDVITELRGAEIARLEMLEEQLQPVLAQVREDCDLFDVALVASEHPRLFIDTTGFVEMGPRSPSLPLFAGHAARTHHAQRDRAARQDGRGGDELHRAAADRTRAGACRGRECAGVIGR
jgi:hypothetical protein